MPKNKLHNIFDKHKYDMDDMSKKSRYWFQRQAMDLRKQQINPTKVMRSDSSQLVSRIIPGNLYMFAYDPKTKDKLPYYDQFPLVFPFDTAKGGFIGLNMHYLPYALRVELLDRLLEFRTNRRMDETTRLKYSWQTIGGLSKFSLAQPCVKRYLVSHVRSQFRLVDANDWGTAMLLPVERFTKATRGQVWSNSRRYS